MKKEERVPFKVYNALLCLLAAAAALLVCLCVEAAEKRWYWKLDISDSRVSELSEYTLSHLDALTEDVTLYPVWSAGSADSLRDLQLETLYRMAARSARVTVEEVDPAVQPQILASLNGEAAGIPDGTVFVRGGGGTRTVRLENEDFIFSRRIGEEIYTIYCGEARLIGAIDSVCTASPTGVWFVGGHGEAAEADCAMLALHLRAKGFAVRSGELGRMTPAPDDVLLMLGPARDLTAGEAAALIAFLDGGGRLLIAAGADTPLEKLSRLSAALDLYGLSWQGGWVVENEAETAFFTDRPELLTPALAENPLLDALPGRLILPRSTAVSAPELRPGIETSALLVTSERAARRADASGDAYTAGAEDVTGRQLLAVYAESGEGARIVQLGSVELALDQAKMGESSVQDASENLAFLAGCVDALAGRGVDVTLDAGVKRLSAQLITFDNERQRQQVCAVLLAGLPTVILLVMGIVLVQRRRL